MYLFIVVHFGGLQNQNKAIISFSFNFICCLYLTHTSRCCLVTIRITVRFGQVQSSLARLFPHLQYWSLFEPYKEKRREDDDKGDFHRQTDDHTLFTDKLQITYLRNEIFTFFLEF